MNYFIFNWYKNEKYGEPVHRQNVVAAANRNDAELAFYREFGNPRWVTVNWIQPCIPNKPEPRYVYDYTPDGECYFPNKF